MATAARAMPANDHDTFADHLASPPESPTDSLPAGFAYDGDALMYQAGDKADFVASRIDVLGETRDGNRWNWGKLLRWRDRDRGEHEWAMPNAWLEGDCGEVRRMLLARGATLGTDRKAREHLATFLSQVRSTIRIRAAERLGWSGPVFVLPSRAIGDGDGERIVYQGAGSPGRAFEQAGSLDGWREHVAAKAVGNSRLALGIAAAFAGPLLEPLGYEGGGVHFRGASSSGKTTILRAAASVWGPHAARMVMWRATDNGMEGVAELGNDTLLCLDELGQAPPGVADKVSYMLSNGVGKARAKQDGAARDARRWRVLYLSSGEIGLGDAIARDKPGRGAAAGQDVRVLDLEADAGKGLGAFADLHGAAGGAAFAHALESGAINHHGWAGAAFLEALTADREALVAQARRDVEAFKRDNLPAGADGQVGRAADRFAIIAAAGELAASLGVLPWNDGEATWAAGECLRAWIDGRGGSGAGERAKALEGVRGFIGAHAARFEPVDPIAHAELRPVNHRAGFWRDGERGREWLILTAAWGELWTGAGLDPKQAARHLAVAGVLRRDGKANSLSMRLPDLGKQRVYAVTLPDDGAEHLEHVAQG